MKFKSSLEFFGCFVVWAPFALCGEWSAGVFQGRVPLLFAPPFPLAVTFAALCALLFFRSWKAIVPVLLSMPAYFVAYESSAFWAIGGSRDAGSWDPFLAMSFGGLVGAVLMTLSFGIFRPRLRSMWCLAGVAVIGAVAALPFGAWVQSYLSDQKVEQTAQQLTLLRTSYAFWQAVVGTYLYVACTLSEGQPGPAAEEHPAAETAPADAGQDSHGPAAG